MMTVEEYFLQYHTQCLSGQSVIAVGVGSIALQLPLFHFCNIEHIIPVVAIITWWSR